MIRPELLRTAIGGREGTPKIALRRFMVQGGSNDNDKTNDSNQQQPHSSPHHWLGKKKEGTHRPGTSSPRWPTDPGWGERDTYRFSPGTGSRNTAEVFL